MNIICFVRHAGSIINCSIPDRQCSDHFVKDFSLENEDSLRNLLKNINDLSYSFYLLKDIKSYQINKASNFSFFREEQQPQIKIEAIQILKDLGVDKSFYDD